MRPFRGVLFIPYTRPNENCETVLLRLFAKDYLQVLDGSM